MNRYVEDLYSIEPPERVAVVVGNTLHRGYRDPSGVFTLEGDNIDAADETVYAASELPDGTYEKCGRCFPNG